MKVRNSQDSGPGKPSHEAKEEAGDSLKVSTTSVRVVHEDRVSVEQGCFQDQDRGRCAISYTSGRRAQIRLPAHQADGPFAGRIDGLQCSFCDQLGSHRISGRMDRGSGEGRQTGC